MSVIRFLARPMLASSFVITGLDKLKNADDTARQLSPVLRRASESLPFQTDEKVLARVIGGAQLGAGALLGLGPPQQTPARKAPQHKPSGRRPLPSSRSMPR